MRQIAKNIQYGGAALALVIGVSANAEPFDLSDIPAEQTGDKTAAKDKAELNAFDQFLFTSTFKNPVGNYRRVDEWEKDLPVVRAETAIVIAGSVIDAARDENDARALSAVLAAYRDGADKELIVEPPSITTSGAARTADSNGNPDPLGRDDGRKRDEYDFSGNRRGNDGKITEQGGVENNPRLGARIVSNLATFRSCTGALVNYLNHLSAQDKNTADWARMIRVSMGFAALPPDESCL